MLDTGNSLAVSASRANTPAAATARECLEETGLAVVVGPLRRITIHRYPHGLVKLHFYDCTTEDPTAEPTPARALSGLRPRELASLRFPEANEAILRELVPKQPYGTGLGFKGIGGSRSTT